jgi:hypothetical protein
VGGALLAEAWNFNSNHEWIGDGTFAVSWALRREVAGGGLCGGHARNSLDGILNIMPSCASGC